jgi:hypothetical protein
MISTHSMNNQDPSLRTLEQANIRLNETIGVGNEILTELDRNRATLNNIKKNTDTIDTMMDNSRAILRSMSKWFNR